MRMPSLFRGVTVKQLLVLVTVGCATAYLLHNQDEIIPEHSVLERYIRAQEQVDEQVGAILGIRLVRQVEAYPVADSPGYLRSLFAVEGERGSLMVTLKQIKGEEGIELTEIRRP
ncbi:MULTISPECIES: hypothetical protein [Pseudomonas]|uniref:Uncharacterized protein n=1 Tax=Pseudomonas poae TaxID=200451 RepID=A0AAP2WEM6_9PSED|nr:MULTISPECIES: hypothetical protein [Pseudomonas]KTC37359.1 hypothetical protein AO260_11950 [Pseudomonas sp. ABAC21]AGE25457.1 hypothetical protein H045_06925 [Pseudomonas poae RE*1-1-14]KRP51291.1 hypothetical protein TU75_10895 [Pseudomonas poae]MCF5654140.1 hypothetical protein [Pseudomonas poae]MCF5776215.1 hypothetical protein [Pseudomonas poae]